MAIEPTQRLSDTEREGVVAQLRDALGEGRLDLEDFRSRLDAAYSARTHGEVVALTSDLPAVRRTRRSTRRRLRHDLEEFAGANAVLWSIWGAQVLTGGSAHDLWPLFVLLPWGALVVVRNTFRH